MQYDVVYHKDCGGLTKFKPSTCDLPAGQEITIKIMFLAAAAGNVSDVVDIWHISVGVSLVVKQ